MLSGLKNAPATLQAYIDDCLRPYIDDFTVCYCDEILIYSANEAEHEGHVRKVLQRLQEFGRYCNAESANLESGKSASSDLPSIWMESACSLTAYPRSKTGRLRNQFGMFKFFLGAQTCTRDPFGNMQR